MPLSRSIRHRLALTGIALTLTAAAIGLVTPLWTFYRDLIVGSEEAERLAVLSNTAAQLLEQRRLDDAQSLLQDALRLAPRSQALLVQHFFVGTWVELVEAVDFGTVYQPGKHAKLVPLLAEGYRLAKSIDSAGQRSEVLAHLGLLHIFDPTGIPAPRIEAVLREAIELAPDNVLAWLCLGHLLQREGRPQAARAALQTTVNLDAGQGVAWAELGRQWQALGHRAAALEAWLEAYRSRRPSLALSGIWVHRARWKARDAIQQILSEDLHAVEAGLSSLSLDPARRLALIEELSLSGASHALLLARARSAAGQHLAALAAARQAIDLDETDWRAADLSALSVLSRVAARAPADRQLAERLRQAWRTATQSLDLVPLPAAAPEPRPGATQPVLLGRDNLRAARLPVASPLFRAGLRVGDRIESVGGQAVATVDALARRLHDPDAPGSRLPVLVSRGHRPRVLLVSRERR